VGRHAESGSDGRDRGSAPVAPGRRRTDSPDGLWRGPAAPLGDHPTAPGRERSDDGRRPASHPLPAAARTPEPARQLSRSRLPLPPVPAASRATVAAPPRTPARPAPGPLTSVAPFQAVPSPEARLDLPADDVVASVAPPVAAPVAARGDLLERPARVQSPPVQSPPAPSRPSRSWPADEPALVSTGPSGLRTSGSLPRVPSQTTAAGSSGTAYGDWTKPSASGRVLSAPFTDSEIDALSAPDAPGTTAIPERSVRRRRSDAVVDDVPAPVRGPGTGPAGGRAAMRAERQAADAVRRKAEGRRGSAVAVLEEDAPRKQHRVLKGLVAMTVVALGVLGVYSYVSPETQDVAAKTTTSPATTAPVIPDVEALPALPTDPIEVDAVVASPVRVPVTVLNSTDINGLAATVAATVAAGGWETPAVGAYTADDVAASTVFFTEGDENQRQAALQLIEMFPQLQGPTPRFFEVPAGVTAPGLVVVTTGDWQP